MTAMLDRRYAELVPTDTDLRWIPALLALLLLVWRFAPDLSWLRERQPAKREKKAIGSAQPRGLTRPA
jgi:mxaL protein